MGAASAPIFVSDTRNASPRDSVMSNPSPAPGYRPCVGITVVNASGLVWVGRRADGAGEEEGRGQWWQMPQGGIDADEDPADAALTRADRGDRHAHG